MVIPLQVVSAIIILGAAIWRHMNLRHVSPSGLLATVLLMSRVVLIDARCLHSCTDFKDRLFSFLVFCSVFPYDTVLA